MTLNSEALAEFLDAYDRKASERRKRTPFVPWDQVRERLKCKPEVWARIRRMNPDHRGIKPYQQIRGYHPRRKPINMDVIGPKAFIAKYGRDAYRSIPNAAFIRNGHRKFVTAEYVMDNF